MKHLLLLVLVLCGMVVGGCAQQKGGSWSVGTPVQVLEGFDQPECVVVDDQPGFDLLDSNRGNVYVSSLGAGADGPWADDKNGFISRLGRDGRLDLRFHKSTEAWPINSPKGMCILNNTLYIADNTRILRLPTNRPGTFMPIRVAMARHLNDMATDGQHVYVSDMETGMVHKLVGDRTVMIKGVPNINGITFFKERLFAVSWTTRDVYELDPTGQRDPVPFGVASHFTNPDGIEVMDDGTFIVSDQGGNKVCTIAPDRKTVSTLLEATTASDIGVDRGRMLLYVPLMMENKVVVYPLRRQ